MNERPILFSAPMVRALLAGQKTQTRREIKRRPGWPIHFVGGQGDINDPTCWGFECNETAEWWLLQKDPEDSRSRQIPCPHGNPGDQLYVRETWSPDFSRHYPYDKYWFAADDDRSRDIEVRDGVRGIFSPESGIHVPFRWRPSIHMLRGASRIQLEITGVRVERLNDISEQDALAEGIEANWTGDLATGSNGFGSQGWVPDCGWRHYTNGIDSDPAYTPEESFQSLWESINGAGSWAANPWVWVVEFRRLPGKDDV